MALVKHNNNSLTNLTALPSAVPTGKMTLLNTATASSSASLSFDSTYINSDYLIYKFEFINMHPATDNSNFSFNFSTDNGSSYNVTKTSSYFYTYHNEGDVGNDFSYDTGRDLAQSTSFQFLTDDAGSDSDHSQSGSLIIFNPSSTVFVKHFIATMQYSAGSDHSFNSYIAGYGNTSSAINAIQFKQDVGNIDAGQIKLYGLAN